MTDQQNPREQTQQTADEQVRTQAKQIAQSHLGEIPSDEVGRAQLALKKAYSDFQELQEQKQQIERSLQTAELTIAILENVVEEQSFVEDTAAEIAADLDEQRQNRARVEAREELETELDDERPEV